MRSQFFILKKRSALSQQRTNKSFTPSNSNQTYHYKNRKKPQWVIDKVLYLKAINPAFGCGTLADTFNRLYWHKNESVSKTYVYNKLKTHQYQIQVIRRGIKNKPPRKVPTNQTWGLDLTTVTLKGKRKQVLGIIDHGCRLNLKLKALESKHSARVILEICQAIKQFGLPKTIRTDNEACFKSFWFRGYLKLLGIKHQTSDIACPWQNGRIERFFGTFKQKWEQLNGSDCQSLQAELDIFQAWYNQIRPHQNLNGLTPMEAFKGYRQKGHAQFVSEWDGLLTGYYFPD